MNLLSNGYDDRPVSTEIQPAIHSPARPVHRLQSSTARRL